MGDKSQLRGLQADLNLFGDKVGNERVKVDGIVGEKTAAAFQKVYDAAVAAKPALAQTAPPAHGSVAEITANAEGLRGWLAAFALGALGLTMQRRYHMGTGKDWNVKGAIAYGAGEVNDEFKALQTSLNQLAGAVGFKPLEVDGFIGQHTAEAVTATYKKVLEKNPLFAATPFPPPDTKEECAEYAGFIHHWLDDVAIPQLVAKPGA
jgi:lysozyme family protein